jgi:hypothetical protein
VKVCRTDKSTDVYHASSASSPRKQSDVFAPLDERLSNLEQFFHSASPASPRASAVPADLVQRVRDLEACALALEKQLAQQKVAASPRPSVPSTPVTPNNNVNNNTVNVYSRADQHYFEQEASINAFFEDDDSSELGDEIFCSLNSDPVAFDEEEADELFFPNYVVASYALSAEKNVTEASLPAMEEILKKKALVKRQQLVGLQAAVSAV